MLYFLRDFFKKQFYLNSNQSGGAVQIFHWQIMRIHDLNLPEARQ